MPARFFDSVLLPNGDVKVSGPFSTTDGTVVGDVQIRFLIIEKPDDAGPPARPWMIDDVATWVNGSGPNFEHVVPAARVPAGVRVGADVRGIGLAVVVKRFPDPAHPAPPAFETLTWCVDLKVVDSQLKPAPIQPTPAS